MSTAFLGIMGPNQMILILVVVLLLFGGRKIPELMRGLGRGVKEFKDGVAEDEMTQTIQRNKPKSLSIYEQHCKSGTRLFYPKLSGLKT